MKIFLAAAVFISLLLGACEISKPNIPQWDIDISIPLLNERFMVSDLADSLNIVIGEDWVLTITGSGSAETPPFGDVNFVPEIDLANIPLYSGTQLDVTLPLYDPMGSVFLSYGEFDEGDLNYQFALADQANAQITLTLPDIKTPAGLPFSISYNGTANVWQSASLVDCQVGFEDSGVLVDSLRAILSVTSDLPDNTLLGEASLRIDEQIGFRRFQGYLYNYVRALEGTISTINIDYPFDLEDAVQLQAASVHLEVLNETGFAAEFHGEIQARNNRTGRELTIPILNDSGNFFEVLPGTESESVLTEFNFTNQVSEILQIMPDEVQIINSYLLINGGHDGSPGFVQEIDKLFCDYQFDAPFQLVLFGHSFEMKEPVEVGISESNQNYIEDNLQSADLTVSITNQIPLGARATLFVSPFEDIDTSDPASYSFSKTITVHSSEYAGPEVNAEGVQTLYLSLSSEELQAFTNPFVYLLWSFELEPSDGPITITASPADYIEVKSMLRTGLHIEVD